MAKQLPWEDVESIANEAFSIWSGSPELGWARQAWAHLSRAGLTEADAILQRVQAQVRFLVLASLYRDWCTLVWDEVDNDSPSTWIDGSGIDRFHIGQLCGLDEALAGDAEDDFDLVLFALMDRERSSVVDAVVDGFGGANGLFVALWRSRTEPEEGICARDEEEPSGWRSESDDEILNDVSSQKLAGFQWIHEGCPSQGPIRCRGEIDT
jgi:hypothetical protein